MEDDVTLEKRNTPSTDLYRVGTTGPEKSPGAPNIRTFSMEENFGAVEKSPTAIITRRKKNSKRSAAKFAVDIA